MFLLSYFKKSDKKPEKETPVTSKKHIPALVFVCSLVVAVLAIWSVYRVNHVPSKAYCESLGEYSLSASTEHERENFFSQFGFTAESVCHSLVQIPSEGKVFEEYNALQKSQGLDLRPFAGKSAHQYIFRVEVPQRESELYAVMTVYKDKAVALHFTGFVPQSEILGLCGL